uniref:Uncharacterized protein n=1 Tax=Oryza punctata TaxID=4537 RepID=A0A0E0LW31_ORYPU
MASRKGTQNVGPLVSVMLRMGAQTCRRGVRASRRSFASNELATRSRLPCQCSDAGWGEGFGEGTTVEAIIVDAAVGGAGSW